jgi:dihydroneopterin aldolase
MGLIAIEGIKFYAYHGYYPEEQILGTDYLVDVYAEVNTGLVVKSDNLSDTVNYETIYRIVKVEMSKKSKLIETVAQRIINRIKSIFDNIETLKVRISKLHPPLGSSVARSYVELTESYITKCDKCQKNFLSQTPGDAWTKHGKIYPETQATLMRTFGKNICKACLTPYFIKPLEAEE